MGRRKAKGFMRRYNVISIFPYTGCLFCKDPLSNSAALSSKATAWMDKWTPGLSSPWAGHCRHVRQTETLARPWTLQSCWDKRRGWMHSPRSGLEMGVGGWSRSIDTGKLSWNICFSFPTFSDKNILLVRSKDKNSFFFGQTHFCQSQSHSFIPKPCTRESDFSV